jgi:hypothetical protein
MPVYTVNVTLRLSEVSERRAYHRIERLLDAGRIRKCGIEHIDSEVTDTEPDELDPEDTEQ